MASNRLEQLKKGLDAAYSPEISKMISRWSTDVSAMQLFDPKKMNIKLLDAINDDELKHQPHLNASLSSPEELNKTWQHTWVIRKDSLSVDPIVRKRLIANYRGVRLWPYHPYAWIGRAQTLLELGYGELAVADAYRARLLCDSILNPKHESLESVPNKQKLRAQVLAYVYVFIQDLDTSDQLRQDDGIFVLLRAMQETATLLMASALYTIRAFYDLVQVLEDATKLSIPQEGIKRLLAEGRQYLKDLAVQYRDAGTEPSEIEHKVKKGMTYAVSYPWISKEDISRSGKTIKKAKVNFETVSSNGYIGVSSDGNGPADSHGVFAKQDIPEGALILRAKSIYTVVTKPYAGFCWACCASLGHTRLTLTCCKAMFCSTSCKEQALKNYHNVLCGKDFAWLSKACEDEHDTAKRMIPLIVMKVLASSLQTNAKPLKLPCVAALLPGYDKPVERCFTLFENVVAPVKILQILGVDIFAESRFDSWVLQTLFLRILNNRCAASQDGPQRSAIYPMYCLFNHNCDPTAIHDDRSGAMTIHARRNIPKGAEISLTYVKIELPEAVRREQVKAHIGKICECARCACERRLVAAGKLPAVYDPPTLARVVLQGSH